MQVSQISKKQKLYFPTKFCLDKIFVNAQNLHSLILQEFEQFQNEKNKTFKKKKSKLFHGVTTNSLITATPSLRSS